MSTTQTNEQIQVKLEYLMEYISQMRNHSNYAEIAGKAIEYSDDSSQEEGAPGFIRDIDNTGFSIHQYRVFAGFSYRIWGKGVRYTVSYPIALFTQEPDGGEQNQGTVLVHYNTDPSNTENERVPRDFDTTFAPEVDGYITVATYTGLVPLCVERINGKPLKIQVFGDSMSDNYDVTTWLDCLPKELKDFDLTVKNSAIGGSCLTDTGNREKPGVSYLITDPASEELEEDNDLVIVFAGCNDWAGEIKSVGHMGDDSTDTIYGAVEKIIQKVCGGTDTKLMFLTPMQRNNDDDKVRPVDGQGNMLNKRGEKGCFTLVSVVDAIKEVCAKHAVPCVDMYREGCFNIHNIDQMTYDGLHASETGAKLLAKLIAARIKMLF